MFCRQFSFSDGAICNIYITAKNINGKGKGLSYIVHILFLDFKVLIMEVPTSVESYSLG